MPEIALPPETVERIANGERVTIEHPNLGSPGRNGSITLCLHSEANHQHLIARETERRL